MTFTNYCTIKYDVDDGLLFKTKLDALSNANVTSTAHTNKSDYDKKQLESFLHKDSTLNHNKYCH